MPDPVIGGGSGGGSTCAPIDGPYMLATADSRFPDGVVWPGVIAASSSAPSDTRYLWRDTSVSPAALKYFNGSIWAEFEMVGPSGPAGPGPWSLLTADFTAGSIDQGGLTASVTHTAAFAVGAYVMLTDITGAQALYRVTSSPSTLDPSSLILTRAAASPSVASTYVFAVANAALVTLSAIAPPGWRGQCLEPVVVDTADPPDFVFACGDIVMAGRDPA